MKTIFVCKRYSVDINGAVVAAFDNETDAREFVACAYWCGVANIYDHEKNNIIFSEVLI